MIASRSLRILPWCAALLSSQAAALGLGEINLYSRIGEPIRAEIPLLAAGERLDPACFSLAAIPGSDIPAITAGRIQLLGGNRLLITGRAPVTEPVFMINVKAACGHDLQREYTLLPLPPESQAQSDNTVSPAIVEPAPRKARRVRQTTPADIDGEPLRQAAKPRQSNDEPAMAEPRRPAKPRAALAEHAPGKDKLVLGAALDQLPPPAAGDPLAAVNDLEERMLKMETTLHLINAQVDKLDAALALDAEARSMRQKLQDMQAQQTAPGIAPRVEASPPPAPVRTDSSHDGWVELVLGILLGGSVSATVAHLVSRRQDNSRPFDLPPPHIAKPKPVATT
ncbi:MAG: hypothetical protein KA538_11935 [Azonexus sp.]|jgi:pilus assembly protein FimV|nr:hypothetical protein [Azonexus sp.]